MTSATSGTDQAVLDAASETHRMTCMEIFGGHHATEQQFAMTGLDVWAFSQPHEGDASGGDIHYVSMCGAGRITRFLLADVAGHGQTVSRISADLRDLMRRHINQLDTTRLAGALNDEFTRGTADGLFATALLSTWFAPTEQLIVVNAGHPRPLWYKAASKAWEPLTPENDDCDREGPNNLPLGIIEGVGYPQFAVTLERGDVVALYTDSLVEARAAGGGALLGEAGLRERLEAMRLDPEAPDAMPELGRGVLRSVEEYRGGEPPDDDQTLILLRHTDQPPPEMSLLDHLKVMAKMVGLARV